MKPPKTVFVCQECGSQSPKWLGRCADCGSWNSFVEERVQSQEAVAVPSRYAGVGRSASARLYSEIEIADRDGALRVAHPNNRDVTRAAREGQREVTLAHLR